MPASHVGLVAHVEGGQGISVEGDVVIAQAQARVDDAEYAREKMLRLGKVRLRHSSGTSKA